VYAKLDAGLPELAEDEENACWAVLGTKRRARAAEMRTTTAGRERCWRASHVAAVILGKYGGDHGAGARRALVLTAEKGATHVGRRGQNVFGLVTFLEEKVALARCTRSATCSRPQTTWTW
jgi:hypothetical protein